MDAMDRTYGSSAHIGRFFLGWMQNPVGVGALIPSGRELSRLMVSGLGAGSRVLELGSGTGTITRAILAAGVRESDLEIVEYDRNFIRTLRAEFPRVGIHEVDALTLSRRFAHLSGQLDCIVSGLPLLLFSRAQRMRVLAAAFTLLGDGGWFHQFTYAGRCPVDRRVLARLGLTSRRVGIAARNFPPAFVYRIQRDLPARPQ